MVGLGGFLHHFHTLPAQAAMNQSVYLSVRNAGGNYAQALLTI